jgi:hypothetical protein
MLLHTYCASYKPQRLKQEDLELETSLSYIVRFKFPKPNNNRIKQKIPKEIRNLKKD